METTLSKYYIKGFNYGYFLAKYQPSLLQELIKTSSDIDYIKGLRDGKKTLDLNKTQNRIQELNQLQHNNDKKKGLER